MIGVIGSISLRRSQSSGQNLEEKRWEATPVVLMQSSPSSADFRTGSPGGVRDKAAPKGPGASAGVRPHPRGGDPHAPTAPREISGRDLALGR